MWFTVFAAWTLAIHVHAAPAMYMPPHQGGVVPGKAFDPNTQTNTNSLIDVNFKVKPATGNKAAVQSMPPPGGVAPLPLSPEMLQDEAVNRREVDSHDADEQPALSARELQDVSENVAPEVEALLNTRTRGLEADTAEDEDATGVVARSPVEDATEDADVSAVEAVVARSVDEDLAVIDEAAIEARHLEDKEDSGPEAAVQKRHEDEVVNTEEEERRRIGGRRRVGITKRTVPPYPAHIGYNAVNRQPENLGDNTHNKLVNTVVTQNKLVLPPVGKTTSHVYPSKFANDLAPTVGKIIFVHGGYPDRHLPEKNQ